jgi:hypothetical protein
LPDNLVRDLAHWEHVLAQHNAFYSVRRLGFDIDSGRSGDGLLVTDSEDGDGVFVHRHLRGRRDSMRDTLADQRGFGRKYSVPCARAFRYLWPARGEFRWEDSCRFLLEVQVDAE